MLVLLSHYKERASSQKSKSFLKAVQSKWHVDIWASRCDALLQPSKSPLQGDVVRKEKRWGSSAWSSIWRDRESAGPVPWRCAHHSLPWVPGRSSICSRYLLKVFAQGVNSYQNKVFFQITWIVKNNKKSVKSICGAISNNPLKCFSTDPNPSLVKHFD